LWQPHLLVPTFAAAQAEGLAVSGPLVPDTAFTWIAAGKPPPYDGYVAMYHDQGLIPFKMTAFDTGVNVTLGLPLIRTSPDHGTAFDLAWQGLASAESLACAIRLAARMAAS
ncbi:MAG TPA: 4-hydroxythreonine-4-phosphate dehydrogenase PdxA, partial [Kiritimatiellia bacterium]|nr:4-hydroxythreonine-4-phosphate dehydrogenase PdxA [Kiritimatiellia bacterium]